MEIKNFLLNHPAISPSWIEKQLDLPKGTIRITTARVIPEKYKDSIISLLKDYGWNNNNVAICDNKESETTATIHSTAVSNKHNYFIKNDGKVSTVVWRDISTSWPVDRQANYPTGTKVIIIDK